MRTTSHRLAAEFIGTGLILATVIGSGISAERLCDGNMAVALLGNTLSIAAMLWVAVVMFGPISGAHFNPVATLIFAVEKSIAPKLALAYVAAQLAGAFAGLLLAHAMFGKDLLQHALQVRSGPAQWLSEAVASFGLILTVLVTHRADKDRLPHVVSLYVFAACWFTGSACFLNPAMTLARAFTVSMTGIRAVDVAPFMAAQVAGGLLALPVSHWVVKNVVAHSAPRS